MKNKTNKILRIIELVFGIPSAFFTLIFFLANIEDKWYMALSTIYLLFISPNVRKFFDKKQAELNKEKEIEKINSYVPPVKTESKPIYAQTLAYIVPINRTTKWLKYTDYLFNTKQYYVTTRDEIDPDYYYDDDIVYKYNFDDIQCELVDKGNLYEIVVNTPDETEPIGTVRKSDVGEINAKCKVRTEGGRGWKVYINENGDTKISSETSFPYTCSLVISR